MVRLEQTESGEVAMLLNLEAKVGLFVVIVVTLLIVGLMWLSGSRIIDRGYQIEAEFEHVGGLRPGAPVQMSGGDIGRVGDVLLTPTGKVIVRLKLKPGVRLNTGSIPTISTAGVLGEKMIEILPGEKTSPLTAGTTLQGIEPFSTEQFLQESLGLLSSVKRVTDSLEQLLSDQELGKRVMKTTVDLETISENLAMFSTELSTINLLTIINNLEEITTGLTKIEYEKANTILTSLSETPALFSQLNNFLTGLDSLQAELNIFLAELRADGQTSSAIKNILTELEPTATNLNELSAQLVTGDPNLADLLLETQKMLESINSITKGINNLLNETANEENTEIFKSSLEKAGRVLNLADEFFETYDRLSFSNQLAFSTTQQNWGFDYQSKLSWDTGQFLLFSCEDFGDQNLLSFQYGIDEQPWQFRLGILHNWLGMGLNYNFQKLNLQADLWQPHHPVLDFYTKYQLNPIHLNLGFQNLLSASRQWYFGLGWTF